jgi:HSP20 family protein
MLTVSPFPLHVNGVFSRRATLNRAMEEVVGRADDSALGVAPYWTPNMDAWETEQAFVVQLDLPGLTRDQVEVNFDRNTLSIRGTRAATIPAAEKGELRVFFAERLPGTFSRTVRFPQYVEASKIEAAFNNGVLTVTIPKSDAGKPRKIEVN